MAAAFFQKACKAAGESFPASGCPFGFSSHPVLAICNRQNASSATGMRIFLRRQIPFAENISLALLPADAKRQAKVGGGAQNGKLWRPAWRGKALLPLRHRISEPFGKVESFCIYPECTGRRCGIDNNSGRRIYNAVSAGNNAPGISLNGLKNMPALGGIAPGRGIVCEFIV